MLTDGPFRSPSLVTLPASRLLAGHVLHGMRVSVAEWRMFAAPLRVVSASLAAGGLHVAIVAGSESFQVGRQVRFLVSTAGAGRRV